MKPNVSTMWAPTDPLWNEQVEVLEHRRLGPRDLLAFARAASGARAVILNGAVPFRDRYRDLVLAVVAKCLWNRPRVVITDATWDLSSTALESRLPSALARLVPRIAKRAIALIDSPRVHYAVLSRDEARTFGSIWGADADRVHFVPFPHTLFGDLADTPVSDGGYVFAGGNSMRDYDLLEEAVAGTGIAVHVAAKWTGRGLPNITSRALSHEDFFADMAGSAVCVVPLLPSVRSAGQQTYLNAMALGKLVIVTEAAGVHDYIEDGVTGVICPRDPAALRAAIEHALDPANRELYERIAASGQRQALDTFNATEYRRALLRLAEAPDAVRGPQPGVVDAAPAPDTTERPANPMGKKIVFLDGGSPVAYSSASMTDASARIGGAELTTIRIAQGLAARNDVVVAQPARAADDELSEGGVRWVGLGTGLKLVRHADQVVVSRRIADSVRARLAGARRIWLWYHDWIPAGDEDEGAARLKTRAKNTLRAFVHLALGVRIIAVSQTHAENLRAAFGASFLPGFLTRRLAPEVAYNAIDVTVSPDADQFDPDKLIYCSAPWKGLGMVVAHFARVKEEFPSMRLMVASPGYDRLEKGAMPDGVEYVGTLAQEELLHEIGSSLCVFYPANLVPETFGIVFLESHAVGTPVLTHRFGAAVELLGDDEMLDATDPGQVVERIAAWRAGGRPAVGLPDSFRTEAAVGRWEDLLTNN